MEFALAQEETLWYQKCKESWIELGDRNTKFFHTSTIDRQQRNKIKALCIDEEAWQTESEELENIVVQALHCPSYRWLPSDPTDMTGNLFQILMEAEVWFAVSGMRLFKAPRADGFQPLFF